MRRQVLKFDDIKGMLNDDEMKGVVGGCAFWNGSSWVGGWGGGAPSNVTPVLGGDIGGNPTSPDHILNGSSSSNGESITYATFAAWAITQPEGTYTSQGNGSFSFKPISDPVFTVIDNQNYVSFDNGNTWNPAFDTINVYGSSSAPLYPLENLPVYNMYTDTYNVALTTLSDYNGDNITGGMFSVIGSLTGNKSLATWINDFSLTDQSNIRANVNDIFIDILRNETGARLIHHASGPTTVEIPNFSTGLSGLTVYMQNMSDKLYQELLNNSVMSLASDGSGTLILNETKYYEYKYGGAFQNFLNGL